MALLGVVILATVAVVLLVESMDWSIQLALAVVHHGVEEDGATGLERELDVGLVSELFAEVVHQVLVSGSDGLFVLVLLNSMATLPGVLSASLKFSVIQHLPSASLATA